MSGLPPYQAPINIHQGLGWQQWNRVPVVLTQALPWRRVLMASDGHLGGWRIFVGDGPRFADPATERVRRLAVLEARQIVRDGFGLPRELADDLWETTVR